MHLRLVDQAIRLVLQQRPSSGAASRPGLSNQDLFYTQVTDIDAVISALFAYEENRLHMSSDEQEETADLIIGVGTVMVEGVFREALQYRKNHSALYQPYLQGDQPEPEFVPWTGRQAPVMSHLWKCTHTHNHYFSLSPPSIYWGRGYQERDDTAGTNSSPFIPLWSVSSPSPSLTWWSVWGSERHRAHHTSRRCGNVWKTWSSSCWMATRHS